MKVNYTLSGTKFNFRS